MCLYLEARAYPMAFEFSDADIERIASVLGVSVKRDNATARFELSDETSGRRLVLELTLELELPSTVAEHTPDNLVSVYAPNSFLQLHGCTGYVASHEMGEVIFFARKGETANGLVVERQAGCSLYANMDERLLTTDFTKLPPELVMGSVALSMSEDLFTDLS